MLIVNSNETIVKLDISLKTSNTGVKMEDLFILVLLCHSLIIKNEIHV